MSTSEEQLPDGAGRQTSSAGPSIAGTAMMEVLPVITLTPLVPKKMAAKRQQTHSGHSVNSNVWQQRPASEWGMACGFYKRVPRTPVFR